MMSISFGSCIRSTLASELFIHEEVSEKNDGLGRDGEAESKP